MCDSIYTKHPRRATPCRQKAEAGCLGLEEGWESLVRHFLSGDEKFRNQTELTVIEHCECTGHGRTVHSQLVKTGDFRYVISISY